ncbi:MAG: lipopolysaccharide kinase InaA family protein [Tannerellaceae bacterium]|jgi:tRNA A-37 threonylcarbamoyl transferase component Bud32|nr:lipopolysaccharide kinase InaA family protein [Tannerellaceae bacterium]
MINISFIHPDFKVLNSFVAELPDRFSRGGKCIHKGRNELRVFQYAGYDLVVKSYQRPNIFNRFVYGRLRRSKAERAYRYAMRFQQSGIATPTPIAFLTQGCFCLTDSYFVCLKSFLPYTFHDLQRRAFSRLEDILRAVARNTAAMHKAGFRHRDYTGRNILFDDVPEEIPVEFVDLNRMSFGYVSVKMGCEDLKYMDPNKTHHLVLLDEYCRYRNEI